MAGTKSTNIVDALVAFFAAITQRDNIDASVIAAAAKQHVDDQATITALQAAQTTQNVQLTNALASSVSPEVLAAIDSATIAVSSGSAPVFLDTSKSVQTGTDVVVAETPTSIVKSVATGNSGQDSTV